jgi:rfaE bifunctional protein nucleotidyltransferase chain/domain/rfaE bifunctional protein kinase chain/domain
VSGIVVIGDALLDRVLEGTVERVCPDAPAVVLDAGPERATPGGAALAAVLAAAGGDVVLVTALARDLAGRELRRLLEAEGIEVVATELAGSTPEKLRVRASGQSLLRIDRGGSPGAVGPLGPEGRAAIEAAEGLLVADYGHGVAARADVHSILSARGRIPLVWDPHPRGGAPMEGVQLATPNAVEAALACPIVSGVGLIADATRARALAARWKAMAVVVTRGPGGAVLSGGDGPPLAAPAPHEINGDPCGAGDCFAATATLALASGAVTSEAVVAAVEAASTFVGSGGVAGLDRPPPPDAPRSVDSSKGRAAAVAETVRADGGVLVATGGCFDLLHAGHVAMLQAARRLGDALIVCMNADASIRRLKGAGRPVQSAKDRAAVLQALDCVDAVDVFDEDTPVAALEALRPDMFVKGGDYGARELAEEAVVARWGGQVVVVPYLAGRSSTRLIEVARRVRS